MTELLTCEIWWYLQVDSDRIQLDCRIPSWWQKIAQWCVNTHTHTHWNWYQNCGNKLQIHTTTQVKLKCFTLSERRVKSYLWYDSTDVTFLPRQNSKDWKPMSGCLGLELRKQLTIKKKWRNLGAGWWNMTVAVVTWLYILVKSHRTTQYWIKFTVNKT